MTILMAGPAYAAAGISQQINFQGRLLNGQGAVVADGYYNIEFRIYQDGDGQTAGDTTGSPAGSLKWTEDYLNVNSKGVLVKNGFMSVQLGSVNPFGSSVDWNQDTLWLSMNVASTNTSCGTFGTCTPDGEMTPMKRLSATPYALNANMLGGFTSAGFIQNTTTPQTADFNISGNGVVGGTMSTNGLLSATAGLTASGAAINLNSSSNFAVNIGTGTSTGAISIGSGLNTFSLNSTALDISTAGVITGATGISSTGTITGDFFSGNGASLTNLNATNLTSGTVGTARVSGTYSGITGTGALATGSIASGFGTISTGNSISTTSVVSGSTLTSTVATGTAPITVSSTTKVTNLNADLLDGLDSTAFAAASGSANYIQNGTTPQTANFNITGNGVVGGTLSAAGLLSATAGLTASGAAINLNNNSNFAVNIGTGTSTGAITLGGGLNTFSLDSTALDISTTGVITGATGISSTGTITGGFFSGDGSSLTNLNASNLASGTVGSARVTGNYTGITGTGALATGSIASGFGTISTGNTIATTSTVSGSTLTSTVATGTAPITVNSTTKVTNLNADLLDGLDSTAFAAASGSANYIQNTTSLQTANFAVASAAAGSVTGLIQGASGQTADIFQVKANGVATALISVSSAGAFQLQPTSDSGLIFNIKSSTGNNMFSVDSANARVGIGLGANNVPALTNSGLEVKGALRLSGSSSSFVDSFVTPLGTSLNTKINIPLYDPGAFNQVLALGLPSTADTNARAILIADARASAHQASVGVLSPNEGQILGLSWDGSNTVGALKNTAASIALQGNSLNILTAKNNAGVANVGIGNAANGGYALDVTGDINTSGVYRVGGTNVGVARSCAASEVLLGQVTVGGITTGGTCTVGGSGGVSVVGAFVNGTSYANGATISTNTITFGEATATNPGMVSASTQTFGGDKTFTGLITQNLTATSGTGVSINTTPASGTVTSSLGITNSGAGNVTNGILVNRSGGGTTANGIAISTTGGAITNGLTFSGTIGTDISRGTGTLSANGGSGITLATNGTTRATFDTSNGLYLGPGVTAAGPGTFTVSATGSSATGNVGGTLALQGGNATVGNANGGSLNLSGGAGIGTGVNGLVLISTPTFATNSTDANCYTGGALVANSCTIAATSINNSSVVLVGFSATGKTATLPDPTILTAGRVVYITAANGSSDFTLSVNGGGVGNVIAMRQNTSATMIWNGIDWTAAGASSSTTLQSAYDNTLQSAGGAELVVSKSSNTNGLTIRDSLTAPVNGTLLSVQTASAAGLLSVNSSVSEYASDAGAETAGASNNTFPVNTWAAVGSSTVSRYTTAGNFIATGQASASVATTTAANDGVKNTFTTALTANTIYNVSFAVRLSSGTFTDMSVYYSVDGTAASTACVATQAVTTSVWTKVNCSFTAPASGITTSNALLMRQTSSGTARTLYFDNMSVTLAANYNYATDGSVDNAINFSTNWTSVASATVSRSTSVGNDASDSAQVVTTTTGQGVRNKLSINPLQSTLYRVTVYAASTTAGFDNLTVRYSRDGGSNFVNCADYNTQTVSSTVTNFTKITCYITTDGTAASSPYVYFTQTDSVARTFYIDTFTIALSSNTTPNVQIGGGVYGGPVTLLTMDRAASAPIASNNDAFLGSMYYDTSLGKLQCYEADGWGACGSSPDNIVTISPEYTNAVMHGTGVGTMTSDICSSTLNINNGTSGQPTICGTNETYNFYKWSSPQASAQTYSIYVTYQLPATFKAFASGQTSIMGRTDSTNSTVQYQIYKNDPAAGLTACGSAITISTGTSSVWKVGTASGAADPSTCGFAPSNSIVFKIDMISSSNANAYVGNLNFTFSNN